MAAPIMARPRVGDGRNPASGVVVTLRCGIGVRHFASRRVGRVTHRSFATPCCRCKRVTRAGSGHALHEARPTVPGHPPPQSPTAGAYQWPPPAALAVDCVHSAEGQQARRRRHEIWCMPPEAATPINAFRKACP
jgi:hypothetical protein